MYCNKDLCRSPVRVAKQVFCPGPWSCRWCKRCMCLMSQTVSLGKQMHWTSLGRVWSVMSSGPHPSGDSTDDHLQVRNHHDWVARDFLVLGSDESSKTSLGGKSVDSTIQQQTSQQSSLLESSCLASGSQAWILWKIPRGSGETMKEHSSRRICESIVLFWEVVWREPGTIPHGANFLKY